MVVQLDRVVPFGRSFDEYRLMFNLTEAELNAPILGVGDGPASFNAESRVRGGRVVSVDALYTLNAGQIRQRFDACVDGIIDQVKASPGDWVWTYHRSPDELRRNRERAVAGFLDDFSSNRNGRRYIAGELPHLPFCDRVFPLALCSHFLFLYSDHCSFDFHLSGIREMLRVATEVRVFPLLTLAREPSPHLEGLTKRLQTRGVQADRIRVGYELQRGGNEMLVLRQN